MDREKFWKGLGAHPLEDSGWKNSWFVNNRIVGKGRLDVDNEAIPLTFWADPDDAEDISLELLLDGLERLARKKYGDQVFVSTITTVYSDNSYRVLFENYPAKRLHYGHWHLDRRAAIIAAIKKLLEAK